jgi:hypothetical protein
VALQILIYCCTASFFDFGFYQKFLMVFMPATDIFSKKMKFEKTALKQHIVLKLVCFRKLKISEKSSSFNLTKIKIPFFTVFYHFFQKKLMGIFQYPKCAYVNRLGCIPFPPIFRRLGSMLVSVQMVS